MTTYRIVSGYDPCGRCGQCCGAPGSPNRDSPWPDNWPEAVASWQIDALADAQPIFTLSGHPDLGGQRAWAIRVGNKTYRGIWIPGHGLCADAPPYGDASAFEEMCPFLGNKLPNGSYPCGLAGTPFDAVYQQCMRVKTTGWTEQEVEQWQADHPLCSYVFEAEE